MLITAYGARKGRGTYSGESFGIQGRWPGRDRGRRRSVSSVVIDLGRSTDGIGRRAVTTEPDVIVLTHDDDDHIGGAPAALRSLSPSRRRQIWLPADWWYVVAAWGSAAGGGPAPIGPPVEVHPGDVAAVADAPRGDAERPYPDQVTDRDVPRLPGLVRKHPDEYWVGDPDPLEGLVDMSDLLQDPDDIADRRWECDEGDDRPGDRDLRAWLDRISEAEPADGFVDDVADAVRRHREQTGRDSGSEPFPGEPEEVAERVVWKSRRILEIVRLAAAVAEVRWFTVDTWPAPRRPWRTEGIPGAVTVVNAHEVSVPSVTVRKSAEVMLRVMALTVQNRRALVTFVWPERYAEGGFLGWSDSGGEGCDPTTVVGGRTPWEWVSVMSAPHHGSKDVAHDDIWLGRKAAGEDRIGVLLCNNWHTTRPAFWELPRHFRASTQVDGAVTPASPRDAVMCGHYRCYRFGH